MGKLPYTSLEEQIADAMVRKMDTDDMIEVCRHDCLKTLNDCTEGELLQYEKEYLNA